LVHLAKNGADPYKTPLASNLIINALEQVLSSLGPAFYDAIFENLEREGMDLSGNEKRYSLYDVRAKLNLLVGEDASELLVEKITDKIANAK
jgi:hypothetical protein